MAFGKKMQDIFDRYVAAIEKLGDKFNFYKMGKALDSALKNSGLTMNSPQFIAAIFDELEVPKSNWEPEREKINKFFEVLPDRMKKERISREILVRHVPREDWDKYSSWVSAKYKAISHLKSPYVVLMDKQKSKQVLSFFLGDVTEKLGIGEVISSYDDTYEAIEAELGRNAFLKTLAKYADTSKANLEDWPNLTTLKNVKYEISFPVSANTKIWEKAIEKTLIDIGII